jgi:hypothetical protein
MEISVTVLSNITAASMVLLVTKINVVIMAAKVMTVASKATVAIM